MATAPLTKINRQDLKIYPSERLTDNDDGGGMPLGTPLTGTANELFNPISHIERINGAFHVRLEYAGLLREDDEALIGAYMAITKPPKDRTVSYLLCKANFGETRKDLLKRIESYNVATIESRMTLLSDQPANSKVIQAYQSVGEPLPMVGDIYCLDQNKAGYPVANQFVQITRVTSEERDFTDGQGKKFKKMVLKLEISSKLEADFIGIDYPVEGYAPPVCKIRETGIADAAQYYGVKPLAAAIAKEVSKIQITSLMEKIVPTNQVSTPLLDLTAAGQRQTLFDGSKSSTDGIVTLAINKYHAAGTTTSLYFGNAITPSSVVISSSVGDIIDKGGTLYREGQAIGTVNYAGSLAVITEPTFTANITSVKFRPASAQLKVADTMRIPVDKNNQSTSYTFNINPPPAVGTLKVSYRSQGSWYDLMDDGTGALRGASAQHGSGNVSFSTGSGVVTLGELPDVGSAILFSWGTRANYFNRSDSTPKAKMVLQLSKPAIPSTLVLSWVNGGNKAATGNRMDNITGDWTGHYDRTTNQILIDVDSNFSHPAGSLDVIAQYATAVDGSNMTNMAYTFAVDSNGVASGTLHEPALKGTIIINWDAVRVDTGVFAGNTSLSDDGNGNLVDDNGDIKGTINYATGAFSFDSNKTMTVNTPIYQSELRVLTMGSEVYQSA